MATFMTNLWEAVFTPGPTPTLLLATNATFALLQFTLAGLLYATFSIHFLVLSILCGGLGGAINWFAAELIQAQQKEEEADRIRKHNKRLSSGSSSSSSDPDAASGSGVDLGGGVTKSLKQDDVDYRPTEKDEQTREAILNDLRKSGQATGSTPASTATRQRKVPSEMSASGEISTDSEWEKIESER